MSLLRRRRTLAAATGALLAVTAAIVLPLTAPEAGAAAPPGLHVSGDLLLDSSGAQVVLRGVDRSGSEYACIQGFGFFDGPSDAASISAMAAWHINAVRVPLNEDCWLGINNASAAYSGANYQSAIEGYVNRLHAAGLTAILDLHWTAAGTNQSTGQQDMPDADHAPAFWSSVASAFKTDGNTVFDLFNEPHDVSWPCWRDGGDCGIGYQVAGMQSLVSAVRATGATNPVMIGGLAYANDLSSWFTYRPSDPTGNVMASWHSYNFNACNNVNCWNTQIAPVAAQVPLVTGEVGENDCAHGYLDTLLPYLDSHTAGYLGWGWDTFDCSSFPALISNYDGTPTSFGIGLKNHLATLISSTTPPATPTTTPTTGSTVATTTTATTTTRTTSGTSTSATSTTATPTTSAPTSSPGAGLTAQGSAMTGSAPWWWEEDLAVTPSAPVTALKVTITVNRTAGINYSGFYTNAPGGALTLSETTGTSALTYEAVLNAGQSLPAGSSFTLGVQYSGNGNAHNVSGDLYQLTAVVGGRSVTASGMV